MATDRRLNTFMWLYMYMIVSVRVLEYTEKGYTPMHVSVVGEYIPKDTHNPEVQGIKTTCS